jgi:hypothetical protein
MLSYLWGFYLPFAAGAYLLAEAARKNEYNSARIHSVLFITVLTRFLFSGFDMTTTVLVMTTVPLFSTAFITNGTEELLSCAWSKSESFSRQRP